MNSEDFDKEMEENQAELGFYLIIGVVFIFAVTSYVSYTIGHKMGYNEGRLYNNGRERIRQIQKEYYENNIKEDIKEVLSEYKKDIKEK